MLTQESLQTVLDEFTQHVIPVMYRQRYHLRLAKGGPDYSYLPEQSLFVHVVNGVFGLAQLLRFIIENQVVVRGLTEQVVRKVMALFCVHDVHKLGEFDLLGKSEFSIPLERLQREWEALGLTNFAGEADEHLMRAINVSRRSRYQGDLLLTNEPQTDLLWLLKSIADNMASAKTATEAVSSLEGTDYIKSLSPQFATNWRLYAHEAHDIRGALTNLIHSAVGTRLGQQLGFYGLLYFPTGTLYIGPKKIEGFQRDAFISDLVGDVLHGLEPAPEFKTSFAAEGLRRARFDFQPYVYSFADIQTLLGIVLDETQRTKPDAKAIVDDVEQIATKKKAPAGWRDQFEQRFGVSLAEPKDFNEHWSLVRRYLLYVDTLLQALAPQHDRFAWYATTFAIPKIALTHLREDASLFASGGPGKHVIVPAYHFLRGKAFAARPAEATDTPAMLLLLHQLTLEALKSVDTLPGRQAAIDALGFRDDLQTYLNEQVYLSFAPEVKLSNDVLSDYLTHKKKGYTDNVCSLCNRASEFGQPLRTDILGDFGRVFSNRVLPAYEAPGGLRPWCPICHLEFVLRKFAGLALTNGAAYEQSSRINLYVFPAFSFTPDHTRLLDKVLKPLRETSTLPVRDYGKDSVGVPHQWVSHRTLDLEWIEAVQTVLSRESARIAQNPNYVGETMRAGRLHQAHFLLIPWEKAVRDREKDDARIPTLTEAWAKAAYSAAIIASLTGCRVYVTARPYFSMSDPADLKATVTLDSPPAVIAKLLGNEQDPKLKDWTDSISLYGIEEGRTSGLERALDLLSALWVVTSDVHKPDSQTKDKYIAERLGAVMTNPLAGAHFYTEYARLNLDVPSPFPHLTTACAILLEHLGGDMMNLVTRIAEKTLDIRLPYREYGRGKAHSYELTLRETVDAMRRAYALIPELRQVALTGAEPSAESIAELKKQTAGTLLKSMERRADPQKYQNIVNPWRGNLNQLVGELVDLIVDQVFVSRANGSFARFLRLENGLADGIYYCTDQLLPEKWERYKQVQIEREVKSAS
jgi:hypothetical protein